MAIILRDNTPNNTGKGAELTYLEMDTNLESFYYSSSIDGTDLSFFTTGSTNHVLDLSGIASAGGPGAQGIQGLSGTGTQGIQGLSGTGTQGIQGLSGGASSQGTQGIQGTRGLQGLTGTGLQGTQGTSGATTTITDEYRRAFINSPDDIQYIVDSNTTEVIIGDATPLGSSVIDEINGRTILINQSNTNNGTLRFGFASWTGQASSTATARQTFECTGYNIGQDDFNVGVYLPQGTWAIYQIGHNNGGGNLVSEYETSVSIGLSGAPRYFTREMQKGAMFKVYYNYFHKKVVIWCSHWSGAFAASGAITFSGTNPN
jgi:hypothetical protein